MYAKIRKRYAIVGGDFSAQEPRLLAHMCQDKSLINIFENGKDPYATIASFVFKKDYWECMEIHEDGTPNPDGKVLRSRCKQIMLGVMYGMGAKLMASILKVSIDECLSILEEFYSVFPSIKEFTLKNELDAKNKKYVEDYLGRRRHLPDAGLNEIETRAKKNIITDCNLFLDCNANDCEIKVDDNDANIKWSKLYKEKYANKGFKAKSEFKELAKCSNIDIFDNGAFISKALTQCTNARIQGGAASLTKKAMALIHNDERMKDLGFRLLIPVHDELLGECPIENVEEAEKRLSELMISAAKPECSVNMKVDTYITKHWYADEVMNSIYNDYNKAINKGESRTDIIANICNAHPELSYTTVVKMCDGTFDLLNGDI